VKCSGTGRAVFQDRAESRAGLAQEGAGGARRDSVHGHGDRETLVKEKTSVLAEKQMTLRSS